VRFQVFKGALRKISGMFLRTVWNKVTGDTGVFTVSIIRALTTSQKTVIFALKTCYFENTPCLCYAFIMLYTPADAASNFHPLPVMHIELFALYFPSKVRRVSCTSRLAALPAILFENCLCFYQSLQSDFGMVGLPISHTNFLPIFYSFSPHA
jgi:hypothetical protein